MISSFRHKGLEEFYRTGSTRGIKAQHAPRLRILLTVLEAARAPSDISPPGARSPAFGLHPLKGARQDEWAMTVQANWRLTFRFTPNGTGSLDYEDYH